MPRRSARACRRACAGPLPHQAKRPGVTGARGGVQQLEDALLARQASDVEHVVAAAHPVLGPEGRVQPEAQRQVGVAARVLVRGQRGHDGVGIPVGVVHPATQNRRPGAVGTRQPRRVEGDRAVVDGDHACAHRVRRAGHAQRCPEGVVQQHHVGGQRAQLPRECPGAQGHPVAVGSHHAQAAHLAAPGGGAGSRPGDDDVVVDARLAARPAQLRVEIGPDAAAALAVEHGHIDHPQRQRRSGALLRADEMEVAAAGARWGGADTSLRRHGSSPLRAARPRRRSNRSARGGSPRRAARARAPTCARAPPPMPWRPGARAGPGRRPAR